MNDRRTPRRGPKYSRDSLERALVLHDVPYSPPEPPGGRRTWLVTTGTGTYEWYGSQVHAFCCGLAMAKLKASGLAPADVDAMRKGAAR